MSEGTTTTAEVDRLAALHRLGLLDTPPEDRFDRVTRLAQRMLQVPLAFVSLVDTDRLFFKSRQGSPDPEMPRDGTFCSAAVSQPSIFVVPDAAGDDRFRDAPFVVGDPHIRFYAGRPLVASGGERVGTLCVMDHQPREFTAQDEAVLTDLADWVEKELAGEAEWAQAAAVQRGLIPAAPPAIPGWDLAGERLTARGVGGHFYDWRQVDGQLVLTLAEVTGPGLGAAIIAATVRSVLRGLGRHEDVAAAVELTGRLVGPDLTSTGTTVSVFHGQLDPESGVLRYTRAGDGLALIRTAGGDLVWPAAPGPPLSGRDAGPRTAAELVLLPGDTLVVASHGRGLVPERSTGAGTAREALDRLLSAGPPTVLTEDVTMLALRRGDR
ncbi:PP2C family protein-serine/threonine phosphatase [Cellulomonas denverensis]|uniref:SpoIIE family protein phosphatase n=1 Tax=Cellulomonas denverensis TaxID=264297 RepID=A0A7X6KSW4_9CELL|nr:GAF domain-containing protein [Cellulomonas denverensis]NKY21510.1 SpoIIE family protein phosphatase [Cellulomonas denverensis]